jgi:hypothetical protein
LNSREGAYLRTLQDLLNIQPNQQIQFIEDIKVLAKKHLNIMDFADEVLKLQQTQATVSAIQFQDVIPNGPHIYSGEKLENALNHLTRGMPLTIYTKSGAQFGGHFVSYQAKRLWIKGPSRETFLLNEILAIDAPQL